jgi:hypothetical protein
MKRLLILCILLLCIIPLASATETWNYINQGTTVNGANWTANASGDYATAWKAGDNDLGTKWRQYPYNDGAWITWNNPLGLYYSKARLYNGPWSGQTTLWTCNGVDVYAPPSTWTNISISGGGPIHCTNETSTNPPGIAEIQYLNGTPPAPIANFTGAPLDTTAPAYVAFTDTSENEYGGCTYNWSFTPADGVLAAPQDLDNEDITMLFTQNGNFTISHGVECPAGSSIKTRADYVHIFNATALSTFRVRAVDMLSGYGINGAQVDVFDIENSSWTNQTSVTGEVTVSALTGHNINAYGSATGYDDGESLALPVVAGSLYPIYMRPTDLPGNVSAGNMTLYVTLLEDGTNTRLSGYSLTVFAPYGIYFSGETNSNGIFQTTIANRTDYNIEVGPQKGHLGAQKIFNSGTQVGGGDSFVEQTIWLPLSTVTTGPTVTTLPGGGTPTPVVTVLHGCEDLTTPEGRDKCNTAQGGQMMGMLYEYGAALVGLCILTIIIGLMKMW